MIWPFTRKPPQSYVARAAMFSLTGKGGAELLNEGHSAYQRNDYATAMQIWRAMADQGNSLAQYCVGVMYAKGRGVSEDYVEAVKWFRKAAEQGSVSAQERLGVAYAKGQGAPQDYAEALKWLRNAADHGDADAQFHLGTMYDEGQGVPQDCAEAVNWYGKATRQGHASAQYNLGLAYAEGRGVSQDFVLSHICFNLAAAHGADGGLRNRDVIAAKMTPDQIAEAERLALEWKPTK